MKGPLDQARALLTKARSDLAQQAAEKSLKAALAARGLPFPWKHDLGELLCLVEPYLPAVRTLKRSVIALSPFAVAARYDEEISPSEDETRLAIELAREVNGIVRGDLDPPS
jgi:HEPN domain-containing protein